MSNCGIDALPSESDVLPPNADGVGGSRSGHRSGSLWKRASNQEPKAPRRMEVGTIGLDLTKNVFHVDAIGTAGEVVVKKALRRAQMRRFFEQLDPYLAGIEACGTSHYRAREISKFAQEVHLMSAAYLKPYVKRGECDA